MIEKFKTKRFYLNVQWQKCVNYIELEWKKVIVAVLWQMLAIVIFVAICILEFTILIFAENG